MHHRILLSSLRKASLILLLIPYFQDMRGQISTPGTPESFLLRTKAAQVIPLKVLNAIDTSSLLKEDIQKGIPNRYGIVQQLNIDIKSYGIKTEIPDKGYIWQYQINSPQAYSLGIHFSRFFLPEGASVFIYDQTHTQILGAFTSIDNNETNQLAIAELIGTNAIIEYFEPTNPVVPGELILGTVSQAYKDMLKATTTRVSINCPAGANWQDAKHAVCRMTFHDTQYSYYCTGFLVNNVKQDGTPYFQTANHCISSATVAATLVTYFNYENSTCTSSDASSVQSLSGATLKASNSYSDVTLLLLTQSPPANYIPFFAGFDASIRSPQSGAGIHHPKGTPKCIAIDNNAPVKYPNSITWTDASNTVSSTSAPNTHWNAPFSIGSTEEGSSGSPLFDDKQHVIGQLHGGSSTENLYGMFSISWSHSAVISEQLKHWLDPNNTITKDSAIDGLYYLVKPLSAFTTAFTHVCTNTPVTFTDQSKYIPKQWTWKISPSTFQFANNTTSNSQNPQIIFNNAGNYTVSLVVKNGNGSDTITKTDYVVAGGLQVKLTGLPTDSMVCGCNLTKFPLVATQSQNYTFSTDKTDKIDMTTNGDSVFLTLKANQSQYGSFNTKVKVQASQGTCNASDSVILKVVMPANDNIEYAAPIYLGRSGVFSNLCGTKETKEPNPPTGDCYTNYSWCTDTAINGIVVKHSVWFKFQGPSSGKITIDTHGINDRIAVYAANSYSDILSGNTSLFSILAANDDRSSTDQTALIKDLAVTPYKTYWLQVDGNNGATGSSTIDLISNTMEIYPNPSKGQFDVIISDASEGNAVVKVFSPVGKLLYTSQVSLTPDSIRFAFDLSSFSAGMYIMTVQIGGNTMKKKLMILK
jgi:PKD repeat protein